MRILKSLCLLLSITALAGATQVYPGPDWRDEPNPLASPDAIPGGEISIFAGQYPKSFNYYLEPSTFTAQVFGSMYESLLSSSPLSPADVPGLAERWSISDDKRTFTFWIDPRARWSDGKPVTAEDVRWTFAAIMNPEHRTGVHKVSLEVFEPPRILGTNIIAFTAREVHWRNLNAIGGLSILPKHAFASADFNKINFDFDVVSGPYRMGELKEGIFAKQERRDDWWARVYKRNQNQANFQTLTFRFYKDRENAFEVFRKGGIDLYPVYTARLWVNETRGERFQKNWIVKQRVQNYRPIGFQGFAMNRRRSPFDDVGVRRAMAHLLDRETMNRTIMYSQYFMHKSYFEDLYGPDTPCTNASIAFDKERARQLLQEAGWQPNPDSGRLEKNGKPFTFSFLSRDASAEKFLSIYGEDLKDVGIELKIDKKDWSAWVADMDEFNFDMTWASWSAGLYKDPEHMWASAEAHRKGGYNLGGFTNAWVDAMIEKQKTIFDVAKRHAICRQIDAVLAEDVPYALLWNINYTRLLYWNKFGMPPQVLSKYGDERSAYWLWWYDPDAADDLAFAMEEGAHLPPHPPQVDFDEAFATDEGKEPAERN